MDDSLRILNQFCQFVLVTRKRNLRFMGNKNKLPYSKAVENHIKKCIDGGIGIRDMIVSMQHLQDAPASLSSLYRIYGDFIQSYRADLNARIGKRVIDHALEGDMSEKSTQWATELYLRSKGGWSPNHTVNENEVDEDEDLNESAVDTIMGMLGKKED